MVDDKFFNPFCCRNREIYIACIDQLIEKSKEIPVLYEIDARNTLILYLKNCEYTIETENIGEEVGSGKSPQENASAILRYFRICGWVTPQEIGRSGDNIASVSAYCRKLIDAIHKIFDRDANSFGQFLIKDELLNRFFNDYFFIKKSGMIPSYIADIDQMLRRLRRSELYSRMVDKATINLESLDSMRMITQERERLEKLEEEGKALLEKCRDLEQSQTVISEIMNRFFEKAEKIADRNILASLCGYEYTAAQKTLAVAGMKQKTDLAYEEMAKQIFGAEHGIEELERGLDAQNRILEECKRHQNTYGQIPEYVGLKEQINRELERRKISARAQLACEYVISLEDEEWRDVWQSPWTAIFCVLTGFVRIIWDRRPLN